MESHRWRLAFKTSLPSPEQPVLVEVDGAVREGFYNEVRKLWFCGARPIYPRYWRPMPDLPKQLKK